MKPNLPRHLLEAYMLANTPGFLYRKVRSDGAVKEMRVTLGTKRLCELATEQASGRRSFEDEALAYCALVSLFDSEATPQEKLHCAELSRLPWAFELLSLSRTSTTSMTYAQTTVPSLRPPLDIESAQSARTTFLATVFSDHV